MSRMVLKERQFEPTGKNLGDFRPSDLESFDLQYIDSDIDDKSGQESEDGSNKSHVPDPLDDDRLKNSKSDNGSGNNSSDGNQGDRGSNDEKNSSDEPEGVQDLPDIWDPYGNDLDDEDPDMPEDTKNNDSGSGDGGGYASPEDSDVPNQVPQSGQQGSGSSGDAGADGDEDADNQEQGSGTSSSSGDLPNDGNSDSSSGGSDLESLLNDYQGEDSGDSQDSGNSKGNSNQSPSGNESPDSSLDDNNNKSSGTSSNSSSSGGQSSGDSDSSDTVPSAEELEAEDDDFDSSDSLSDLEQALDDIDSKSSSASKQKNKSDMERAEQEDDMSSSPRDMEDEIAAAKDLAGKAARDMRSDKDSSSEDDSYDSVRFGESEEDILQDLGLGNLTSVFNPGNLQDWRARLDKIFDKALGFDIVTNPNLVNKKIEDAPPGREDDTPQIDNIAILLDMSGSMGAGKFKEVINHIDTMIRARKLNRVWFHIIGFGSRHIRDIERYYDKVKGMKLKQTLMTKYKKDANWMTDFLPGMQFCVKKVPRPDGIIIMTDAEFNGNYNNYLKDTKVSAFMKKNKKRVIWALTSDASLNNVTAYDSSAVSNKRYIKFKKDGSKD